MDLTAIIIGGVGIIGSVASIVALFVTSPTTRQRIIHGIWGISLAIFVALAVWSRQKLARIANVERAASRLIDNRWLHYTDEGFVQAALAFLESNRDLYPDAYARAKEIGRINDVTKMDSSNQITAAYALEGLLRGISILQRNS